jgi:prepilin-type processing-associated H-X9-DG protein
MSSGVRNGNHEDEDWAKTNMAAVADSRDWTCDSAEPRLDGDGTLFNYSNIRFKDITDGTSQTFLVGEVIGIGPGTYLGFNWPTWNLLDTHNGVNLAVLRRPTSVWTVAEMSFSSFHPHGCHFVFADGHVQFVNENVSPKTLAAMSTRAAGDVVPGNER